MQEVRFRNKVNWISIICAVLVVLLHSFSFNSGAKDTFAYHLEFFISRSVAKVSVPTFFALSAFLFYRKFDYSILKRKLYSRVRSLVVPYILWNTISMIAFYFLSRFSFINTDPFDLNLRTVIDSVLFYEYNQVFWFVFQLILLTYLFPLLYPLVKNQLFAVLALVALVCMYGSGWVYIGKLEVRALAYYFFGAYFAVHYHETVISHHKASIWGILAFAASQILIYSEQSEDPMIKIISRMLLIIAIFDLSSVLCEIELPAVLNCSFPIYAMHNLILEFFNKVFSFILSTDSNLILIDYFGSTVLTLLIIAGLNLLLQKKIPAFHSILFGGRGK